MASLLIGGHFGWQDIQDLNSRREMHNDKLTTTISKDSMIITTTTATAAATTTTTATTTGNDNDNDS